MTKVIEGVNVLTYDEWMKLPGAKVLLDGVEDCEDCDGTGEHECSCGDTHDCGSCGGSGKDDGVNIRDIYEETLRDEIKRLIAWRDGIATKHPKHDDEPEKPNDGGVIAKISIHP